MQGSIRRDIFSAYALSGIRILAWLVISALIWRRLGPDAFAILVLVRSTIGLLNYTTLGLGPAMIRYLAIAKSPAAAGLDNPATIYRAGSELAWIAAGVGLVLVAIYGGYFPQIHRIAADFLPLDPSRFAFLMGVGLVIRLLSDPAGAALQVRNRISTDNTLQIAAEIAWALLSTTLLLAMPQLGLSAVGWAMIASGLLLLITRRAAARRLVGDAPHPRSRAAMTRLLALGFLIVAAQAADFLYAPTDYLLISWLLDARLIAVYAPAVQIDSALLLLVGALASVLFPRTAVAHASADLNTIRRFYITGTLASLMLLTAAALLTWACSPLLFTLWLKDDLPATRLLLPLVLVHTVVGGSSAVGRSILLGIGKAGPFTVSVLVAGISNVLLSAVLVRFAGLGLWGIVLATVIAVVGRCAIWMPWYTLRSLRPVSAEKTAP